MAARPPRVEGRAGGLRAASPSLPRLRRVTDLADVLALMSKASDSFQTLRATLRHWRDEEKYMEAWDHHVEERSSAGGGTLSIVLDAGSDEPQPTASEA